MLNMSYAYITYSSLLPDVDIVVGFTKSSYINERNENTLRAKLAILQSKGNEHRIAQVEVRTSDGTGRGKTK